MLYLGMDVDSLKEPEKTGLTKKKLTLAFDEYKRITNMLVVYMRSEEEKRIAGMYIIGLFLEFEQGHECISFTKIIFFLNCFSVLENICKLKEKIPCTFQKNQEKNKTMKMKIDLKFLPSKLFNICS